MPAILRHSRAGGNPVTTHLLSLGGRGWGEDKGARGRSSPFCAAKGGGDERSETQGVHTSLHTKSLSFDM